MKVQHLISTMGRTDFDFLKSINNTAPILLVNQKMPSDGLLSASINGYPVEIHNTTQIGLSNSRNMLLNNATGEICIVGDDDLCYKPNYCEHIIEAYNQYPEADIIVFRFSESKDLDTRNQFGKSKRLNIFEISKVASVEVTFRLKSILDAGIHFDPLLGLGAPIGSGEENAFLADALRAGLVIQYVPFTICDSVPDDSRAKWKDGYGEEYLRLKGAAFYRIYGGLLWIVFSTAFAILKKRSLFKNLSFIKVMSSLLQGRTIFNQEKSKLCI